MTRFQATAASLLLAAAATACSSDAAPPPAMDGGPRPEPDGAPSGSGGGGATSDAATGGASSSGGSTGSGGGGGGSAGSDVFVPGTGGASVEPIDSGVVPTDGGSGPIVCQGPGARYVTSAVSHEFGPGQDVGQDAFPAPILGPPKGAGSGNGSMDVVSLGNGGTVTVAFHGNAIVDEAGPDFIVFENAFWAGGNPEQPFAELGTVAVSDDGVTWHEFPCTATSAPYGQCSGVRPVFANPDENDIDPLDPAVAGGDAYDLADLGVARARYVRITDRADLTGLNGVFDLDAVGIVHAACP